MGGRGLRVQGTGGLVSEAFGHPGGASCANLGRSGLNWGIGGLQTASGALGLEAMEAGPRAQDGQGSGRGTAGMEGPGAAGLSTHQPLNL